MWQVRFCDKVLLRGENLTVPETCYVIYQTQETVFNREIKTPRRELKLRGAAEYF